jgi:hypothetical protein
VRANRTVAVVAQYLVELFVPRTDALVVPAAVRRVRLAAEDLARAGTAVRYLRSIFVPEDEICFLLFEAACAQDVRDAARSADLPFERISEAVTSAEPVEA